MSTRKKLQDKKSKQPAMVPGRAGGLKGGLARAARMTPEERSESARKAVRARWSRAKSGSGPVAAMPGFDASKKALHLCLKRIKDAKDETELRRLSQELQKIVFQRQYRNAED